MENATYKQIEVTGSSPVSSDQAIRNAISKAAETVHNINWFTVAETRGYVENNGIKAWQVTVKIGFRID
jgi:dodecin